MAHLWHFRSLYILPQKINMDEDLYTTSTTKVSIIPTLEPHTHKGKEGKYEFIQIDKFAEIGKIVHYRCSLCKAIVHGIIQKYL